MTEHDNAQQARKGLLDSAKGTLKEVAGAVLGNDSLAAEGQLEQVQAKERREASTAEAVAEAQVEQGRSDAADAQRAAFADRTSIDARTTAAEQSVRDHQAAQKAAAERTGELQSSVAAAQAESEAQRAAQRALVEEREELRAASHEMTDAVAEHEGSVQAAVATHDEAERLRRAANDLSDDVDRP